MSDKNLTVDLKARVDVDGNTFYVGKLKFPGTIDCSQGISFLIFTAEKNGEQLQIAPLKENDK